MENKSKIKLQLSITIKILFLYPMSLKWYKKNGLKAEEEKIKRWICLPCLIENRKVSLGLLRLNKFLTNIWTSLLVTMISWNS